MLCHRRFPAYLRRRVLTINTGPEMDTPYYTVLSTRYLLMSVVNEPIITYALVHSQIGGCVSQRGSDDTDEFKEEGESRHPQSLQSACPWLPYGGHSPATALSRRCDRHGATHPGLGYDAAMYRLCQTFGFLLDEDHLTRLPSGHVRPTDRRGWCEVE